MDNLLGGGGGGGGVLLQWYAQGSIVTGFSN